MEEKPRPGKRPLHPAARKDPMLILALTLGMLGGPPQSARPVAARCPECRADPAAIREHLAELRSNLPREREGAARALAGVRWQCHPEVVAGLVGALQADSKPRVRAEAAEALRRMVPDVPASHLALLGAARSDPVRSVRNQARRALDAKGRRCTADCPICGPFPTGAAITGPALAWPEWAQPRVDPAAAPGGMPPALPDPKPEL